MPLPIAGLGIILGIFLGALALLVASVFLGWAAFNLVHFAAIAIGIFLIYTVATKMLGRKDLQRQVYFVVAIALICILFGLSDFVLKMFGAGVNYSFAP